MYEQVPKELTDLERWVCVYNSRTVPYRANAPAVAASSTNPSTWASFSDAVEGVKNKCYDGIGFVFNGDGIVGIDIDAGFDEDGFLSELSCDCIGSCESYTELSRSGRGVHIILRGNLPFPGRNNRSGLEIYREGRYFIVTGKRLIYSSIVENQEAIDYIVEKYFYDVPTSEESAFAPRIYSPDWTPPDEKTIRVRPYYPEIGQGIRNVSLLSLAGHLRSCGYNSDEVYIELQIANQRACKPPLSVEEIDRIARSSEKYADKYNDSIL